MIKAAFGVIATLLILGGTAAAAAQEPTTKATPVLQAFEHYEAVRVALSADKLAEVAPHAKQLAAHVEAIGGELAKKAANQLVAAKTLEDARTHFGELSTILVPVFQKERIPGTSVFMCSMKNRPWVQKGTEVQNPYYGTAMATCGTPLPAKGK